MVRHKEAANAVCGICGKPVTPRSAVAGALVRESIRSIILQEYPEWTPDGFVCRDDLSRFRSKYIESVLQLEKRDLTALERDVIESLRKHELLSENVDLEFERVWTFGEKLADRIAALGGSWPFLIGFGIFLAAWVMFNSYILIARPFDPYPYILLNLVLSCLAAVQAPLIMMSQRRQEAKDRLRSQHDYQVNLKAELEIRHLHEKVDHLLSQQWERLVQLQEVQLELLEEIGRGRAD